MPAFTAILTLNGRAERVSLEAEDFNEANKLLLFFRAGYASAGKGYPQLEGLNKVQRPRDAKDLLLCEPLFTKE